MAGFVDVLLRGLGLAGQALAVGGILFIVLVLRPAGPGRPERVLGRSLTLVVAGAIVAAVAQCLILVVQLDFLADERGMPVSDLLATTYFRAALIRVLACAAMALGCWLIRRGRGGVEGWVVLLVCAGVLVVSSAWMSHAAARLESRGALLGLDALHQLAASAWVGGLAHLTASAFGRGQRPWPGAELERFSTMALVAVMTLITAGIGLSLYYVDGTRALLGTAYGVMVLTKSAILVGLLALGALNYLAVRRVRKSPDVGLQRVRRFVEVELGLGLTVLFAAASLTSVPPAVDVVTDRATLAEVGIRFVPKWPALRSPRIEEMPVADRDAPRTAEDRAWSEYNHHVAGLFVLAMGLLAIGHRTKRGRWARHWPLIFLGLAGFLLVRNDPGAWPLGPLGFWESLAYPAVLQHRLFVTIVVAFGIFEWMVRTGQLRSQPYALVFPILCAVGGGLLLTHSHAMLNLKSEFLVEVTHSPLGLLAMTVGWGRWLELRLPPPDDRLPGRLWAVGLALIGLLLLAYRES